MATYNIGGATLNQTPLDWEHNISNLKNAIRQAKEKKVEILCLPELSITGYGCEDLFLSEWLPKKAMSFIPELLQETQGIFTTLNLPLNHEGKLYNCSIVVHDQKILGVYAKQFMALDGVHYEPRWFRPWPINKTAEIMIAGEKYPIGDLTFDFKEWKIGFEICEDAWRGKERPACRLYEKKVNLILNPSASHFALGKTYERAELIKGSSQVFQCTYVYANLLGNEAGRMIYDGEIIIAQHGQTILRNDLLSFKDFELRYANISFDGATKVSPHAIAPPDPKEEEFPKAAALALFDYLRKSKNKGYVLSLSGGADSATCAILVAEMVRRGIQNLGETDFLKKINKHRLELKGTKEIIATVLTTAYQSTKNSSKETFNAAQSLATSIGATFYHWSVDKMVDDYTKTIEKTIGQHLTWETDDIALQNIQARARSPIIWMLTNIKQSLLLTTSNRSEGDVGYATMDGDTSGSIAPISSIDKSFIMHWLRYAETTLGYDGLKNINALAPTAELRPAHHAQKDEEDLMPYPIMVAIEKLAIKEHCSPSQVYLSLKKQNLEPNLLLKRHIIKFYRLWSRNQWKRERLAPAFHLDDFNVDPRTWCRFPILSGGFEEEIKALENL